jgi:hypothetical protein
VGGDLGEDSYPRIEASRWDERQNRFFSQRVIHALFELGTLRWSFSRRSLVL